MVQADPFLRGVFEFEWTVVTLFPILVALDLAAFRLRGEHNNYANILLPDNTPEILTEVSSYSVIGRGRVLLTLNVAGIGACVAM